MKIRLGGRDVRTLMAILLVLGFGPLGLAQQPEHEAGPALPALRSDDEQLAANEMPPPESTHMSEHMSEMANSLKSMADLAAP